MPSVVSNNSFDIWIIYLQVVDAMFDSGADSFSSAAVHTSPFRLQSFQEPLVALNSKVY